VDQTRGLERDEVLLTTGFARTPHGRVLHRFGPLDGPGGAGLLTTAVSRARHRLHVVTALRARDLDPSRLRTPGATALARTLAAVEAAAGQAGTGEVAAGGAAAGAAGSGRVEVPPTSEEPLLSEGLVRSEGLARPAGLARSGVLLRSAVLQVLALEMQALGAEVTPGPGGGLAVAHAGQAPWLVVDVDVENPDPAVLAGRRSDLAEAGWQHRLVAAELVAADVAGVALGLLGPLPGARDARLDPSQHPTPQVTPAETPTQAAPTQAAATQDAPTQATPVQDEVPVVPQVSADDTDQGWGGRDDRDDDDERILRERPPHW